MNRQVIATHLIVHGRVQGVFYRDWTVSTAQELNVGGWVRNLPDGTVEAHLEGERDAVETMIDMMQEGPPAAKVERIERTKAETQGCEQFGRR